LKESRGKRDKKFIYVKGKSLQRGKMEKVPDEVFEELLEDLKTLKDHVLDFGRSWGAYANETDLDEKQAERMEKAVEDFQDSLQKLQEEIGG
jgi:ElaB/YqjD/DUF883 family membrane-anchored ribosome-binding protein